MCAVGLRSAEILVRMMILCADYQDLCSCKSCFNCTLASKSTPMVSMKSDDEKRVLTQECHVRCRMTDELDERSTHEVSESCAWSYYVEQRQDRKEETN